MSKINQLIEMVEAHPEYTTPKPCFVSVYRRHRCYGGPEEGGWWYDRDELEGSIAFNDEESANAWLEKAKEQVDKMNEEEQPERNRNTANLPDIETAYHDEGYIPVGWDDGGELWVTVEDMRGRSDNSMEPRPHYE